MSVLDPRLNDVSYNPDRLIVGTTQLVTSNETLAAGQKLSRGTLVGKITATGAVTLCLPTANDGSQVPYGILIDDYDASAAAVPDVGVFLKAEVNETRVILGAGWTANALYQPLRDIGIYLKSVTPA